MRVLVACENSGTVRDAFRARGHDAWSCDLLPADGHHVQGDCVALILDARWDLIIMHPPCTALCVSGNAHYAKGKPQHAERIEAIEWTMMLWEVACARAPKVAMENPVGLLPMEATQYIQPFEFGHPESKKTGLWLHHLPPLSPTHRKAEKQQLDLPGLGPRWPTTGVLPLPPTGTWSNQTPSGQNKLGPSADRWKIRSTTYPNIAMAMAVQWGKQEGTE